MAARAEGGWEEGEEEEMPMAAAVTASRPRRKAPLRVVDCMGEIGLLLAVVGVVGITRGVVVVLLLLLQLGEEEAGSTSSSDAAADREFEAVNLELRAPAVLCRGRRVPKAETGEGKQASTTTTRRRRRGRRLGDIRVGAWRREEAVMVFGRDKQRRGKAPVVVGKLMRELGVSLGWVWVCICCAGGCAAPLL